jgi:subtilisin family serine protease
MSVRRHVAEGLCIVGMLAVGSWALGQGFLSGEESQQGINVSRPVPGAVIVGVLQEQNEEDYFSVSSDGRVQTRFQPGVLSSLQSYGIRSLWKGLHRGNNASYELFFDQIGREDEIIAYLRSLQGVRYAQRDYTVEFFAEPNDFFYQPDSLAPNDHWIPDSMNVYPPPGSTGRGRDCDTLFTCCADSEIVINTYSFLDNLHLPDNWYLQHVQANRAWDIEKGSPDVKIMIMDSGIDIDHPDLAANIWSNPSGDPEGDAMSDGVPGTKGQDVDGDGRKGFDDLQVGKRDLNHNGTPLWGADHVADCGPDGDYGFGPDGIDDPPPGPGPVWSDDDTAKAGPGNDPWDDNVRGPGSLHPELSFDDDVGDVLLLKNDDNEDGYPDDFCGLNFFDPWAMLVPRDNGCPNSRNSSASHGTGMAGIVGAVTNNEIGMAGMAWNCKLVAAKIATAYPESSQPGSVLPIANALYYAVDHGVDVVNMSFGINSPVWNQDVINTAIDSAAAHGIVLLAGAGNEHREVYYYPASNPHVISVSGCNRRDEEATCATCPTFNDRVDVSGVISDPRSEGSAPCIQQSKSTTCYDRGADCVVTAYLPPPQPQFNWEDPNLPHGYAITALLTSGATAQNSGLAALLVSFYPRERFHEIFPDSVGDPPYARFIEREMKRGCVPISGEHADKLGAGRMNAYRSLTHWGRIRNDTTWANFAYVSADIKVDAGKTLTIAPGTTVYFAPDDNDKTYDTTLVELRVYGTLIAEGTAANPIEFKSLREMPDAGDWFGIHFVGENSSGTLSHCIVHDAKYGVVSAVTIEMNHCEITNCSLSGIYLYDDLDSTMTVNNESVIRNCTITENIFEDASGMRI